MNYLKKFCKWEQEQMKKPELAIGLGVMGGVLIGVGMDNIGVGIALGIVFGTTAYATMSDKNKKEEVGKDE